MLTSFNTTICRSVISISFTISMRELWVNPGTVTGFQDMTMQSTVTLLLFPNVLLHLDTIQTGQSPPSVTLDRKSIYSWTVARRALLHSHHPGKSLLNIQKMPSKLSRLLRVLNKENWIPDPIGPISDLSRSVSRCPNEPLRPTRFGVDNDRVMLIRPKNSVTSVTLTVLGAAVTPNRWEFVTRSASEETKKFFHCYEVDSTLSPSIVEKVDDFAIWADDGKRRSLFGFLVGVRRSGMLCYFLLAGFRGKALPPYSFSAQ